MVWDEESSFPPRSIYRPGGCSGPSDNAPKVTAPLITPSFKASIKGPENAAGWRGNLSLR
jgi:hypothetical protein